MTNAVSIVSVMEEVNLPMLPAVIASLTAVFFLERDPSVDPGKADCVIRVTMADGKSQDFPLSVDFQDKARSRAFVTLAGMPVTASGKMRVSIGIRGAAEILGFWDIAVNVIGAPIMAAQTA